MNYRLILVTICVGLRLVQLSATDSVATNKTFLMPRSVGYNLPMVAASFDHLYNYSKKSSPKFCTQTTLFYQETRAERHLAQYFLALKDGELTLNSHAYYRDFGGDYKIDAAAALQLNDLDYDFIVHDRDQAVSDTGAPRLFGGLNDRELFITLDPRRIVQGSHIDLHWDLDDYVPRLYFELSSALADVEHDTRLRAVSNEQYFAENFNGDLGGVGKDIPVAHLFEQYFEGLFENAVPQNKQVMLNKARLKGRSRHVGVADIDLVLGYAVIDIRRFECTLGAAVTLPTGTKTHGDYVFDAVVGNGRHWALGTDVNCMFHAWQDRNNDLMMYARARYRYLLPNRQLRTLGLKGFNLGQYVLLGDTGAPAHGAPLIPAANIITLPHRVFGGSVFESMLGFKFLCYGFAIDAAYDFYFKERERTRLLKTVEKNRYAIAPRSFDTRQRFSKAYVYAAGKAAPYIDTLLDTEAPRTPQSMTHGMHASVSYLFDWRRPLMVAVGGQYQFALKNNDFEEWGVWAKIGSGF